MAKLKNSFIIILIFLFAGCVSYVDQESKPLDLTTVPEELLIRDDWNYEKNLCDLTNGELCTNEIIRRHRDWPAEIRQNITRSRINTGMDKHQLLASWGWPTLIKIKNELRGKKEQWEYASGPQFVYFQNGKVVDWAEEETVEFFDVPEIQAESKSILLEQIPELKK